MTGGAKEGDPNRGARTVRLEPPDMAPALMLNVMGVDRPATATFPPDMLLNESRATAGAVLAPVEHE